MQAKAFIFNLLLPKVNSSIGFGAHYPLVLLTQLLYLACVSKSEAVLHKGSPGKVSVVVDMGCKREFKSPCLYLGMNG